MEEVSKLEKRLLGTVDAKRLNEIDKLYSLCESSDIRIVAEALQAISRVLTHHRRRLAGSGEEPASLTVWLRQHGDAYHAALAQLATALGGGARARACAVRLTLAALRDESEEARSNIGSTSVGPPERRLQSFLTELLLADNWSDQAAQCLVSEFIVPFVDVRHFALSHLRVCCGQVGKAEWSRGGATAEEGVGDLAASAGDMEQPPTAAPPSKRRRTSGSNSSFAELAQERGLAATELFSRVFSILREVPEPESGASDSSAATFAAMLGIEAKDSTMEAQVYAASGRPASYYVKEYRKLFQDAWLQLLSLPVPLKQCSPVLQFVPAHVMPHIARPLMLADFYLRAFHSGSLEISVLSLSGLLVLLTKHGLGDPDTLSSSCSEYYAQLYSLLQPATFQLRRRARFQRLLAASLSSGLLPARFAGAFAKKCLQIAVVCSEAGSVMWLVAIAYGLIQKHHSHCKYLLHRHPGEPSKVDGPSSKVSQLQRDPFETSASLKEALEQAPKTSLWEIKLLQRHHIPAVAVLAKLFLKPFFKPTARKLDPELFLDHGAQKAYNQAMKAGQRQAARWKAKAEKCPVNFRVDDDEEAAQVVGWAATLSTTQRQLGAGI